MLRFGTLLCSGALALSAMSFVASSAVAAERKSSSSTAMKGKISVGGLYALSGYRALQVKYYLTDKWSLSGSLGLDYFKPSEGKNRGVIDVVFAPGVNYWITPRNQAGPFRASFGLGTRLGIYLGSGPGSAASRSGVSLECSTTAELFFGRHFSLAPEAGLVFRFINNGPDTAGKADGFGLELGHNTGLFGGGSFNFYF